MSSATSIRCSGATNSMYASSSSTMVSGEIRRRNLITSTVGSSVPVGLCGRHSTTTRASAAASASASRS
jgi:hypothetical protein